MKSPQRDISLRRFRELCTHEGFRPEGFMGYYDLGIPGRKVAVTVLNTGPRRRDQIAYLLRMRAKELAAKVSP
jgi:hypothetical protein